MNAREWTALTKAAGRWPALARSIEGPDGGLLALFDDAGRSGLAWEPRGDAARWRIWCGATGSSGPVPERAWAYAGGSAATSAGLARRPELGAVPAPLLGLFRDFAGLHPVAESLAGPGRLELRLKGPAPWPLFAVCDAARPFAVKPAFWARLLGARGVTALALCEGRMEVFVE